MTNHKEYVIVGSGTWGAAEQGHVTSYALDRSGGTLTQIDRKQVGGLASFLARHPEKPLVYVADEDAGDLYWLTVDPATGMLSSSGNRGADGNPVYLSVNATGTVLLSANYGQGTTLLFPLDAATGAPEAPANSYETGPKTHAAPLRPASSHVYVPSLDDNQISQFNLEGNTLVALTPATVAQTGGPRHLAFHPNGNFAYVVSELSDDVAAYSVAASGALTHLETVRRLPAEQAADPGTHTGADIHVTPSGRHAYVSNRGSSNTLAIYSVADEGTLTLAGHESTRGEIPRNFTIDPEGELLLAANQNSQNIALFRIDPESGALNHLETADIGVSPFFVAVWRFEQ